MTVYPKVNAERVVELLVQEAKWLDEDLPRFHSHLTYTGKHPSHNRMWSRAELERRRLRLLGVFYFAGDLISHQWPDDTDRAYVLNVVDRAEKIGSSRGSDGSL